MPKPPVETLDFETQSIEHLKARHSRLHAQKIAADTHLEVARQRLQDLKDEARRLYGTDDVEELQKKLLAMKADNDRKRTEYEAELNRIERELAAIERDFSDSAEGDR